MMKNTAYDNLIGKNTDNVRFVNGNSLPAISQHLTPKQKVDDALDEIPFVRNNRDNKS